ncbi:MAG: hypothetical protein R3176_01745 [Woeseiaceae bacterium]|nr:hypothetical protein [Woeseiaceae bacterium]
MNGQWAHYWALIAGSIIAAGVALFVLLRLYQDSVAGRLRANVRRLEGRYREHARACRRAARAEAAVERLRQRPAQVPPARLRAAEEAVEDARALAKIAADQVQIAENHVRMLIVEEYPPARQETLRARYLKRPEPDGKPFTF